MDKNTEKIIANNYASVYGINTNDLDGLINIIQRDYKKQNYYIYKKIWELANNSFVITAETFFDVVKDKEQKGKLLKDLTNMFLIKKTQVEIPSENFPGGIRGHFPGGSFPDTEENICKEFSSVHALTLIFIREIFNLQTHSLRAYTRTNINFFLWC